MQAVRELMSLYLRAPRKFEFQRVAANETHSRISPSLRPNSLANCFFEVPLMPLRLMTIFRHIVALWLFGNRTYPDYDDKNDETLLG